MRTNEREQSCNERDQADEENCSVEVGVALPEKASEITSDWIARATTTKVNVSCSLVNQDQQRSDLVSSK